MADKPQALAEALYRPHDPSLSAILHGPNNGER